MERGIYTFPLRGSYYEDRMTVNLTVDCEVSYTFVSSSIYSKEEKKARVIEHLLEHGNRDPYDTKWQWNKVDAEELLLKTIGSPIQEGLEWVGKKVCERRNEKGSHEKELSFIYGRHAGAAFDHFGIPTLSFPTTSDDVIPVVLTGSDRRFFCDRTHKKEDEERCLIIHIQKMNIGLMKWELHINSRMST